MDAATMLAILVVTGICSPVDFKQPDNSVLKVIVCPINVGVPAEKKNLKPS